MGAESYTDATLLAPPPIYLNPVHLTAESLYKIGRGRTSFAFYIAFVRIKIYAGKEICRQVDESPGSRITSNCH
jgi:hypothetical protein